MSKTPTLSDFHRKLIGEIDGYNLGDGTTHRIVKFKNQGFDCYECEFAIRPLDKALVVHLKRLPPLLRSPVFFEYACDFWRKRIGAFKKFESYYTDKLDAANEVYSLDMVFVDYYPAMLGDMDYMQRHVFKVASDMNDEMVRELQEQCVREEQRRK